MIYLSQIKRDFQNLKTDKLGQDNRQRNPKKKILEKKSVPYQKGKTARSQILSILKLIISAKFRAILKFKNL